MFAAGPDKDRVLTLLKIKLSSLKLVIELVASHYALNDHLYKIKIVTTPMCEKCLEHDERAVYFICDCPAFSYR